MKKTGKKMKILWIVIPIAIIIVFGMILINDKTISGSFLNPKTTDNRPSHCDENGCIAAEVFSRLPQYPEDLRQVYELIYFSRLSKLENFTSGIPDENYWKQPELYPTFESQGVPYYTTMKKGTEYQYLSVVGYGAYPGDTVVEIELDPEMGGDFNAITFWHASWGIVKYQGTALKAIFPESGGSGDIRVNQNPERVKNYFTIDLEPDVFLLEPSWPIFHDDWVYKITATIHINKGTPPGKYLIGVVPTDVPKEKEDQWTKEYKLGYMPIMGLGIIPGRSTWQIFVTVV